MEVKIISKETIKPSSPTPSHLRKFKLSSLDHLAPKMYMPMIFFYSDDDDDSGRVEILEKLNSLKNSLSETLTRFYPLAGRIMRNDVVECNDEGVSFYDARVNSQLAEVFRQVDGEKLKPLIPSDYYGARSIKDVLLAVQVNIFECGGMAISVCGSHRIIDGSTKAAFLNAWAATARGHGSSASIHPTFDSASLFPIEDVLALEPWELLTKEKIVTKSFVFDESKIDILRGKDPKCVSSVAYPTRVESISAFIWRCAMRAQAVAVGGSCRPSVAIHAVDLRRKTVPPLPEYSIGNLFGFGVAHWDGESEGSEDLQCCLEGRLRKAFRMFDGDHVKKMRGQYEHLRGDVVEAISKGDVDLFFFSSWCKLPFYDVDFGWGKPIWVSPSWIPVKNGFILMGRKCGDGMEVWAYMAEEDMTKFEQDEELLAFASSRALA